MRKSVLRYVVWLEPFVVRLGDFGHLKQQLRVLARDIAVAGDTTPIFRAITLQCSDIFDCNAILLAPFTGAGIDPETVVAENEREQVRGRAVVVKRLKPLPIEAVTPSVRWLQSTSGKSSHPLT